MVYFTQGKKLFGGILLGGPVESDETPEVPDAPAASDLVVSDLGSNRKKRSFFDKIGSKSKQPVDIH